eukprot:5848996-Pyramimonas_sp.AAC.1
MPTHPGRIQEEHLDPEVPPENCHEDGHHGRLGHGCFEGVGPAHLPESVLDVEADERVLRKGPRCCPDFRDLQLRAGTTSGTVLALSLIHISEPTRPEPI